MAGNGNGMQKSLLRMANEDPELAAQLLVTALPAAAASVPGPLEYGLEIDRIGSYRVTIADGAADVTPVDHTPNGTTDFVLRTDPATLARLAAGASPLRLMLGRRLHIGGKRRKALRLRKLSGDMSMRDVARAGVEPDPDLVYRALPYAIDPEWTRGQRFTIAYELQSNGSGPDGTWFVKVDDGAVTVSIEPPALAPDAKVSLSRDTWLRLVRGELSPNESMRSALVRVE